MLTLSMNRYSVVFKAQLKCKTFYGAGIHSEEAMLLSLQPHQTCALSFLLLCDQNTFHGGHMSSKVVVSISVAESIKRL